MPDGIALIAATLVDVAASIGLTDPHHFDVCAAHALQQARIAKRDGFLREMRTHANRARQYNRAALLLRRQRFDYQTNGGTF